MAKKRTDNKFKNANIGALRRNYARYCPRYEERLNMNRIEVDVINKDGSVSIRKGVRFKCDQCGELVNTTNYNIDHIEPVIEIGKTIDDYTLDEFLERLDCELSNLQILCKPDHCAKSKQENELRKQARKQQKELQKCQ